MPYSSGTEGGLRSLLLVSAPCTSYTWQHQCRDVACVSHSPEFILTCTETGCTHSPTSLSATELKMLMEFTGFTIAANAAGIQNKTAALLRELLKQHPAAKQSRVVMALPETFTKSVKGSPTELSSPSQPTQKRQEKEADFTPSSKQTSDGAPLATRFCHPKHTHVHTHTQSVLSLKTSFLRSSQLLLQ